MAAKFERVGIVARRGGEQVEDSVAAVARVLAERGVEILLEDGASGAEAPTNGVRVATRTELGATCDLVVVVGGDGSLLGVGRDLARDGVPVLGVNRGGLGFLAGVAPESIEASLPAVLDGEFVSEAHFLLEATVTEGEREIGRSTALNDVVVHSGGRVHMLEQRVWIDDEWVYDQRGDGLIITTPTGSTAYSLSAGGPIMHPSLDAIAIVPMFPHTLTARPLVVQGDARVKVAVENAAATRARVSCDSQVHIPLNNASELTIRKFATPLQLIYPLDHSFYESCRSKLDWATRLGDR